MSYVNFKEERYKAEIMLSKRKNQYKKFYNDLKQNHNKIGEEYNAKYSYNINSNQTINTSNIQEEQEFLNICDQNFICAHFINCKFYNIKFTNCKFIGCIFEKCIFGGGGNMFENCTFIEETIPKKPSLNIKDDFACSFYDCSIYAKFSNSNLSYCIFENDDFSNSSFEICDLTHVIMKKCNYKNIVISDCDLSSFRTLYPYMEDFSFDDKYKTKLDDKTFFDKVAFRLNTKEEYEGIYTIYEDIANQFNDNNLKNNFGEYYFLCKKIQRKSLKIIPEIISYIYCIFCGYGERVIYPLITSAIIMILFGFVYLITGVDFEGEIVRYSISQGIPTSFLEFIAQYNESLNLSISIFVGLGTSNSFPIYSSNIFFDMEMIVGVIMQGIGIGTITRKLIR